MGPGGEGVLNLTPCSLVLRGGGGAGGAGSEDILAYVGMQVCNRHIISIDMCIIYIYMYNII